MLKSIFATSCLFVSVLSFGQTSVVTAGGSVSNNSGSVSYSIGQVAYQSVSNASGSVSQGVQQVYVISTLSLEENKFNFSLSTYPNPTTDNLNLRVANFNQEKLAYRLIDAEGKLLSQGDIQTQETNLEMRQLQVATYFVEVLHDAKKVQSFKIIKNQ